MLIKEVEKGIWKLLECLLLYEISHQDLQDWNAVFRRSDDSDRGEACLIFRKGECSCIFLTGFKAESLCAAGLRGSEGGLDEKAKDFSSLPKFLNQGEARTCSSRFKEKEAIKSHRKGERWRSLSIFGV